MRLMASILAALTIVATAATGSSAQPPPQPGGDGDERPTAVVTMGDSFISGEAGRWLGNSDYEFGNRRGTDRAAYKNRWGFWRYNADRVYGPTNDNGCHRSDVSPVLSSGIEVDELINLACSGARSEHLRRSSNGGVGQKGEPSQADQLAQVAADHRVEMIVVSIGGNDLGYSDIIVNCAVGYVFSTSADPNFCRHEEQVAFEAEIGDVMAAVGGALDEINAVMGDAGYHPGDYRLVLQSYPSPIPDGHSFRFQQSSAWDRFVVGGCPFWNADATWARTSLAPQLSDALALVAGSRRAEFLDLQDALAGREVCADTAVAGVGSEGSDGADAEWARFVTLGIGQGELQESLHPNAYGQQANGTCLRMLHESRPGAYRCTNVAGSGPEHMVLTSTMDRAVNNPASLDARG